MVFHYWNLFMFFLGDIRYKELFKGSQKDLFVYGSYGQSQNYDS